MARRNSGDQRYLQHHLQVLQAGRALEALELPPLRSRVSRDLLPSALSAEDLGAGAAGPAVEKLPSVELLARLRKAQFWISLLEGEKAELRSEMSMQKRRFQQVSGQAETHMSAVRQAEHECTRLRAQLRWMQKARDAAVREKRIAQQSAKKDGDADRGEAERGEAVASMIESLEVELERERSARESVEQQCVAFKMRNVSLMLTNEEQGSAIHFYEKKLRSLDPHFEPYCWDAESAGALDSDAESTQTGGKGGEGYEGGFSTTIGKAFKGLFASGGKSRKVKQRASSGPALQLQPARVGSAGTVSRSCASGRTPTRPSGPGGISPTEDGAQEDAEAETPSPSPGPKQRWMLRREDV